jgi:hypothetical protein
VHDASRNVSSAFAHASCRIASFRRDRVSKVCYRGGVLLAFAFAFTLVFAASQKCLLNGPPITSPDRLLQILNKTMGVNLVRLSRNRSGKSAREDGATAFMASVNFDIVQGTSAWQRR